MAASFCSPEPSGAERLQVAAFYRFALMTELPALRRQLLALGEQELLRGTVLLAAEGVNGTISGPEPGVQRLLQQLRLQPGLESLEAKLHSAEAPVFHRFKVRLKQEIVSLGRPEVEPLRQVGTYVGAGDWEALISDPDTLVIDTRNDYEVAVGSFRGAIDPGTQHFGQFPAWVEQVLRPLVAARQPRRLALFCTGGIRCEKATSYLLQQGFEGVHHLEGGILRYLEERRDPGRFWQGECFVFDQRVTVDADLRPGSHQLCHACGRPLGPAEREHPAYREGVSCPHCIERFSDQDRARFAERQRQMELAQRRGQAHLGAAMPQR